MLSLFINIYTTIAVLSLMFLVIPGLQVESFVQFFLAAFIVGIMNFVLTPLLFNLGRKIKMHSLATLAFLMNFIFLNMGTGLIDDYSLSSWGGAMFGAILMTCFQIAQHHLDPDRRKLIF